MKNKYNIQNLCSFITLLLLTLFFKQPVQAQCNTTVTIKGGNCEGNVLTANTSGDILRQLKWNWKNRNDSSVFISTAAVTYKSKGIVVAGGNGYDNNEPPLYLASNNQCDPSGIIVDKEGNLYIIDIGSNRVQKWMPGASEAITVAGGNGSGSASNQLDFPQDVVIDAEGSLFISDVGNNRIQKWVPGATEGITVAGGPDKYGTGSDEFNDPWGLYLDKNDNLYVADYGNDRVQMWKPGATEGITVAGGNGGGNAANQIHHPFSVFVDEDKNIYVTGDGFYSHRVQKWTPGATEGVTVAGGIYPGNKSNQLNNPSDVFVDAYGNVFVVDEKNSRIQRWSPNADSGVTVVGGFYQATDLPNDIFISGDTIYESDASNYVVKKFIPVNETPQIERTFTPQYGGNYTATAKFQNGCVTESNIAHLKPLPKFKYIKGQHRNLCGGGIFTYSAEALGEADSYTWVAPQGCTILSGQGTASISMSIPANFSRGVLSVQAANSCGLGPVFYDTLTTKPVKPGAVNGPSQVSQYETVVYSVDAEPGISYRWEIPVYAVEIISGQNTPSITVLWNSSLGGNVIVKASACTGGTEASSRLLVNAGSSATAGNNNNMVTKNEGGVKVYPNPAQDKATVAFTATGVYTLQLSDAAGRIVKTVKGNTAGMQNIILDLHAFSKGLYFVTVTTGNKKEVVKVTKQ